MSCIVLLRARADLCVHVKSLSPCSGCIDAIAIACAAGDFDGESQKKHFLEAIHLHKYNKAYDEMFDILEHLSVDILSKHCGKASSFELTILRTCVLLLVYLSYYILVPTCAGFTFFLNCVLNCIVNPLFLGMFRLMLQRLPTSHMILPTKHTYSFTSVLACTTQNQSQLAWMFWWQQVRMSTIAATRDTDTTIGTRCASNQSYSERSVGA